MTSSGDTQPAEQEDQALCPHCIEPLNRFDHFCPHCAGPVTSHASIDPLGHVFAMGHGYRRATSSHPSRIMVVGMWLIFGPQTLILLSYMFSSETFSFESWSLVWDGIPLILWLGFIWLHGAILWKATTRFFAPQASEADGV